MFKKLNVFLGVMGAVCLFSGAASATQMGGFDLPKPNVPLPDCRYRGTWVNPPKDAIGIQEKSWELRNGRIEVHNDQEFISRNGETVCVDRLVVNKFDKN